MANCRHNWYPYFEGISERAWSEEDLANIDPEPFTFEGKEYNYYEATQKQRQIERTIRKYKHRVLMYDKVNDDESKLIAQVRLQRQRDLYKRFNEAGNLKAKPYNLYKHGYNRSETSKEVWSYKKAQAKANKLYNLGSDKLNLDIYLKDEKLRKEIRSNYNLKVNQGRQDKHIKGTNNYKQELANGNYKSYLLDGVTPQELVDKYATEGELKRAKKVGKWMDIELLTIDENIGYWIDVDTNKEYLTNRFSIHYSKKQGVHIVPAQPNYLKVK